MSDFRLRTKIFIDGDVYDFRLIDVTDGKPTKIQFGNNIFIIDSDANTNADTNADSNADSKISSRSPNNTVLFLNWLKSNHKVEFEIKEFVDNFPSVNMELVEKIVAHQVQKGILLQLSNTKFKVNKNKLEDLK